MADFDVCATYSYPVEEEISFDVLVDRSAGGIEQRRLLHDKSPRRFALRFKNQTEQEMQVVRSFFNSKSGSLDMFTFENPNDGQDYTVRFEESRFKYTLSGYKRYDFNISLVEAVV